MNKSDKKLFKRVARIHIFILGVYENMSAIIFQHCIRNYHLVSIFGPQEDPDTCMFPEEGIQDPLVSISSSIRCKHFSLSI